jgi:SOS-response transcriptional repressor LexA
MANKMWRKLTLGFIGKFIESMGYPPSYGEIGSEFHIAKSTVKYRLDILECEGKIKRESGKSRTTILNGRA